MNFKTDFEASDFIDDNDSIKEQLIIESAHILNNLMLFDNCIHYLIQEKNLTLPEILKDYQTNISQAEPIKLEVQQELEKYNNYSTSAMQTYKILIEVIRSIKPLSGVECNRIRTVLKDLNLENDEKYLDFIEVYFRFKLEHFNDLATTISKLDNNHKLIQFFKNNERKFAICKIENLDVFSLSNFRKHIEVEFALQNPLNDEAMQYFSFLAPYLKLGTFNLPIWSVLCFDELCINFDLVSDAVLQYKAGIDANK